MDADHAITVIVVTWNSAPVIDGFLGSLPAAMAATPGWRLIVVDNASTDGTRDRVTAGAPEATIINTGRNAGYAAGINAGIAAAPGAAAYLLLNPDVRLAPGCVQELWRASLVTGTGIVVPRLEDEAGRLQWSLRRDPSVLRALAEAVLGGARAGRLGLGEVITDPAQYATGRAVDWATGAAMLVTRLCAAVVGPWDESFFLYSEETDFAQRARHAGFTVRYAPPAVAVHIGGDLHVSADLYTLLARNKVRLFGRRAGGLAATCFTAAVLLNEALRCASPIHRAAFGALVRHPRADQRPDRRRA